MLNKVVNKVNIGCSWTVKWISYYVFSETLPLVLDRASVIKDVRIFHFHIHISDFQHFSLQLFRGGSCAVYLSCLEVYFLKYFLQKIDWRSASHQSLILLSMFIFLLCQYFLHLLIVTARFPGVYSPCTKLCSALVAASCTVYLLI